MTTINTFKQHLLEGGVFDVEGTHHEFANGGHGRKLDFDVIPSDSSLYEEWVRVNAYAITKQNLPVLAVLGVANGTNRLAHDIGLRLGVKSLQTEKVSSRSVRLTEASRQWLINKVGENGLVIAVEDVGTTGGTALTALEDVLRVGAFAVEGLFTWQRTSSLSAFDAAKLAYRAVIHEPLDTYDPAVCTAEGYCAQGWVLIPHLR